MIILVISSYTPSLMNFRGAMLRTFVDKGHKVIAVGPDHDQKIIDGLAKWGVEFKRVSLDRNGSNPFLDLCTLVRLYNMIRKLNPDLVLSYTIKPVIYGSIAASWVGAPKIYSMITGLGWAFNSSTSLKQRIVQLFVKKLYASALRKNNGVIFQNPDDQKEFIDKKIVSPELTHRIYGSGVDLSHFQYSNPPTRPVRFLFIGRFVKDKGIVEFIKACNAVFSKHPKTVFHLVGWHDSNPGSLTVNAINELDTNHCIVNHGKLEDVRPIIIDSSVFILPSYREGTPRTALEAMAMGRPLIMADTPGCRETVIGGENGFLVPAKDTDALVAAMEKFINNPEMIEPMGKKSRQIAEELYDVHKVNADIMRILGL